MKEELAALHQLYEVLLQHRSELSWEGDRSLGYAEAVLDTTIVEEQILFKALRKLVVLAEGRLTNLEVLRPLREAKRLLPSPARETLSEAPLRVDQRLHIQ